MHLLTWFACTTDNSPNIHYSQQVPKANYSDKLAAGMECFITPDCIVVHSHIEAIQRKKTFENLFSSILFTQNPCWESISTSLEQVARMAVQYGMLACCTSSIGPHFGYIFNFGQRQSLSSSQKANQI